MISQKYYQLALVSVDVLVDSIEAQHNVFNWLEKDFKERVAEKGMGLLTRVKLHVEHTDEYLLKYVPAGCLRVHMVARVVPIQRLENVESQ